MTPEMLVVSQRGVGPLRQELIVLRGPETHGLNTRREVAELCRITPLAGIPPPGSTCGQRTYGSRSKDGAERWLPSNAEMNARERTETHGRGSCCEPARRRIRTGGPQGCAGL